MTTHPGAGTDVITIAVMGATGTGKSTFVNLLSGSNFPVGDGLLSTTPAAQMSNEFVVGSRRVCLIDTPGFDDSLRTDREILQTISSFLATQYQQAAKLSGVIYMHRISDIKMSGISRRNFGMFRSLCGEQTLQNVVIVTNMWSEVAEAVGAARERELATDRQLFQPILQSGARMMRHQNTLQSAQAIVQTLVDNHPVALQIQSEIVDEKKRIEQTSAGKQLESEAIAEQRRKQEDELRLKQQAREAALRAQQDQQAQQLARARREKAEEEARVRAADQRRLAEEAEAKRQENERLQAAQRVLAAQAEARRAEEERVATLQREAAAQAEARRVEQERMRQIEAQLAAQKPRGIAKVEREVDRVVRRLRKGRLF